MKKSIAMFAAGLFVSAVMAQGTGTVVQSQCRETTKESLVGAGVGAAGGVIAGKALSSMFGLGKTGSKVAAIAGGALGGAAGNAIGSTKEHTCTLLISFNGKNVLHTGTFPVALQPGNVVNVAEVQNGEFYVGMR